MYYTEITGFRLFFVELFWVVVMLVTLWLHRSIITACEQPPHPTPKSTKSRNGNVLNCYKLPCVERPYK